MSFCVGIVGDGDDKGTCEEVVFEHSLDQVAQQRGPAQAVLPGELVERLSTSYHLGVQFVAGSDPGPTFVPTCLLYIGRFSNRFSG